MRIHLTRSTRQSETGLLGLRRVVGETNDAVILTERAWRGTANTLGLFQHVCSCSTVYVTVPQVIKLWFPCALSTFASVKFTMLKGKI